MEVLSMNTMLSMVNAASKEVKKEDEYVTSTECVEGFPSEEGIFTLHITRRSRGRMRAGRNL